MLISTFSGLQCCPVADNTGLYSFVCSCCLSNLRNPAKFSENSNLQEFKVIQCHGPWCQLKAHATSYQSFIETQYAPPTVFEILTHFARKWLVFSTLPLFDAPSRGTPCDINVIYTPLESTFSGLQFYSRHCGSIVIRLAVVASQNGEMT